MIPQINNQWTMVSSVIDVCVLKLRETVTMASIFKRMGSSPQMKYKKMCKGNLDFCVRLLVKERNGAHRTYCPAEACLDDQHRIWRYHYFNTLIFKPSELID